jgi:hypothetical protein
VDTGPLHQSEIDAEIRIMETLSETLHPHMTPRTPHVMVGDSIYSARRFRAAARLAGYFVSASTAKSGVDDPESNAEKQRKRRIKIHGRNNWMASGHRELICRCGHGTTHKVFDFDPDGNPVPRLVGECPNCGPISITAGMWRTARNPSQFVRCENAADYAKADHSFGNPLTHDDPIGKAYGTRRFAMQESLHKLWATTYGINRGKRWIRSRAQLDEHAAVLFTALTAITIEAKRREQAPMLTTRSGPPPASALAASAPARLLSRSS